MAPDTELSPAEARDQARLLDESDELAPFADRFIPLPEGVVYLDGNSLGRPLRSMAGVLDFALQEEWARGLIPSWDRWVELPYQVGGEMSGPILGARAGEVVVSDSTTVNLYKLVSAAVEARPGRSVILIESDAFPTDRYVVDGIARTRGLTVREVPSGLDRGFQPEDVASVLDTDVAVACLSHVGYRSAALADMGPINQILHEAGALVLWDLCHSAGSVPIDLTGSGADLAVGCTYKYLNGGPGAPAFLFVRRDLQGELASPIWGWFGADDQFEMADSYRPRPDIGQFQAGTPPILAILTVREGARVVAEAGLPRLRAKGMALSDLALQLADQWLAPSGFRVASPRVADRRGSHLTLEHRDARSLCTRLAEGGVITDFRTPDRIRLGLAALTTSYIDVVRALEALRALAG